MSAGQDAMIMRKKQAPLNPPNAPWRKIAIRQGSGGYLTFVFSDNLSRLAVRDVTRPGDNKADPNLETLTYGLFSHCGAKARRGIVKHGCPYLFFMTTKDDCRCVTGYYEVGWYAILSAKQKDYCVAAKEAWFIESPVPLIEVSKACGRKMSDRSRGPFRLSVTECKTIRGLILKSPNVTLQYLQEIERLERFNLRCGGYRNISYEQEERFSWKCRMPETFLALATEGNDDPQLNFVDEMGELVGQGVSDRWQQHSRGRIQ